MLAKAGVEVPVEIDLELDKYLDERGEKRLGRKPEQEIEDPFGIQKRFMPGAAVGAEDGEVREGGGEEK